MKKGFVFGVAITLLSCATFSRAVIIIHSYNANACDDLAGEWTGTGKASNWAIGKCVYHGSGQLKNVDATGNFILDLSVDKESGSILCPAHTAAHMSGYCHDGKVTLITDYGHLTGDIANGSGQAKGTLKVSPGITAEVDIQIQKVS